jgi:hypothetical protein
VAFTVQKVWNQYTFNKKQTVSFPELILKRQFPVLLETASDFAPIEGGPSFALRTYVNSLSHCKITGIMEQSFIAILLRIVITPK